MVSLADSSPLLAESSSTVDSSPLLETSEKIGSKIKSVKNNYHALENKWDYVLYFLIGLFSDLDMGFTGTFGYTKYVHVANMDVAPMSLSMFVGGGLGVLLSTFVLMAFKPKVRVVTLALLMILGVLFSWFLPMPMNVYLGYGFLFMGQFGLQATILPLTYYVGAHATSCYQAGFGTSMLMGSVLMQIHDAADSGKAARMITVIIFPTMLTILFFCLDQTPFTKAEEKKNNKSDIESSVVSSKSEEEDKETSERLTKAEMLLAFKEICFSFVPLYLFQALIYGLYMFAVFSPEFLSSSLSYMGKTADTIGNFSDKLGLATSFLSAGIALTLLTPLGRIVSTQKLAWMYIAPVSVLAILTAILIGMYHNAFPPMHNGAFYFTFFYLGGIVPLFMSYGPLFLSNAEYLTTKYNEFQIQLLLGIFIGTDLIVSIFSVFYFSNSVFEACVTNYEANYEGVSCSMFMY